MKTNDHDIPTLIKRARDAQEAIANYTQEDIDRVCTYVGWEVYCDENIAELAKLAVDETGMGNVKDKITKHKNKVLGVLDDIRGARSVGLIEYDEKKKISKYAKPVGVVGALTPVTNPTATPASNAISVLKGRNAVIFAPHPSAKKASKQAVLYMREGLKKAGAPEDLIQIVESPSIEKTNALMEQADVVLATGGAAMVKAAYSSGTPAYGVGPGNSVQIIAEDAMVDDAAKKILMSKTFDYATSCSSENSVIVHDTIYDDFVKALEAQGAYFVKGEGRERLEQHMFVENKKGMRALNPKIIAKSAVKIATDAAIDVPESTTALLVKGHENIEEDLLAREKISPVLAVYRYNAFGDAFTLLKRLIENQGKGHSCGIHTFTKSYIETLGKHMKTSRILVNQPQAAGNGGAFFNGMPSTVSLGCGSWGGNITTENIHYKHFLNVTWLSEYFEPVKPSEETIFGDIMRSNKDDAS